MPFDLNGTTAGIPNKILIPGTVVVVAGGFFFYKRYTASKAASAASTATTATSAATTGSSATGTTPYGPYGGDNDVILTATNSGLGAGQYAALGNTASGVAAQNQAILAANAAILDQEVTNNKVGAALLSTNPGALAAFKKLPPNSVYESAITSQLQGSLANIYPGIGGQIPGGVPSGSTGS